MQTAEQPAASDAGKTSEQEAPRIQLLEEELANTKEYLQSVIEKQDASNEELQSANEEISSANEELQSTNEELETSKEELQSTNEELNTVNDELRARNTELDQLSNDLTNLLATELVNDFETPGGVNSSFPDSPSSKQADLSRLPSAAAGVWDRPERSVRGCGHTPLVESPVA